MEEHDYVLDELIAEHDERAPGFRQLVDAALRHREVTRRRLAARVPFASMAVTAKRLDVQIGDLVEIDGRQYDVVSDKVGGVTLEPAITQTVNEIHAEHGGRPLTPEEFEEHFGHLPLDGEG